MQWFLLGIIVGALGATLGAWWWVRRFWTRARVAERRAARQTRPLAYRVCHTAVIARQAGKAFRELV